ncbi:MAG TPA: glycosyltransferase family 2 protein [Candidatus Gastranaerophilales bacterium]|nr:glycosyltransferase family 2 protein [Candidatus Gastranaerophilales bacterium]
MKVSIITACYNAEKTIEETVRSVAGQTYKDIEYIIVDGASKDSTLSILEKYKDKISKLISEPDNGVFNAQNKGIKAATGDLIFILNADDVFINELVVEQFVNFTKNRTEEVILGDIILLDKYTGKVYHEKQQLIDDIQLLKSTVFHPATFFKREVFEKYGLYNEENRITSDYEWYVNYFRKNNGNYAYLDKPISVFSMSGLSSNEEHGKIHQTERNKIQEKYFSQKQIKIFKILNSLFSRKISKISFRKKLAKFGLNTIY